MPATARSLPLVLASLLLLASPPGAAAAEDAVIVLQSTTSTRNSGLLDHILPLFRAATGIEVRVVAVGTGQALRNAARGDGDVLLVHDREAEEAFVARGHGLARHDLMYNDFVIVGPRSDPAGLAGGGDAAEALRALARAEAVFVSRGDDSGTHKAERRLWAAAGIEPGGAWYRETGSGMGATLNIAAGMGAYALSDRASWIAFGNKGDLEIRVEGDPRLFNQYGVIAVNPERFPHAKAREGRLFVDWLLSAAGQDAIASFRLDGRQLFFPNAAPAGAVGARR